MDRSRAAYLGTTRAAAGHVPYTKNSNLPVGVRKHLPQHAQDIYRAAFNDAFARYGADREAIAHRIAWAAVKRRYFQRAAGIWVPRSRLA